MLQSTCTFFSNLKIGVSPSYFNKKCDEFGSTYNEKLLEDKRKEEAALERCYGGNDLGGGEFGPGWKIVFDNFDIHQKVRDMTEQNQNKDIHWLNHMKVSNRVSGNMLPDDKPILEDLADLDNIKVVPSATDHVCQSANYINLIARVLVEEVPCLEFCKDSVVYHLPHKHSSLMARKSEKVQYKSFTVFLGVQVDSLCKSTPVFLPNKMSI